MKQRCRVFGFRSTLALWCCALAFGWGCQEPGVREAPTLEHRATHSINPKALQEAHRAFASQRWKDMTSALEQVSRTHAANAVVQSNALALLERAFGRQPRLPATWALPSSVPWIDFITGRGERQGQTIYRAALRFKCKMRDALVSLRVTSRGGTRILHWEKGQKGLHTSFLRGENLHYYEIDVRGANQPVPLGRYSLSITLRGGQRIEGWFFVDNRSYASASPTIQLPDARRAVTAPVEIPVPHFRTPEFQGKEARFVYSQLARVSALSPAPIWSHWSRASKGTIMRVKRALPPGRYRWYLSFNEQRKLGPMTLSRVSFRSVPFVVPSK